MFGHDRLSERQPSSWKHGDESYEAMNEVVAPKSFGLLSQRTDEVRESRQAVVLTELLQTKELASLSANIPRGDTDRVVLSKPIGGALNARADGMLDAVVKSEDGKIIAVARLQRAS